MSPKRGFFLYAPPPPSFPRPLNVNINNLCFLGEHVKKRKNIKSYGDFLNESLFLFYLQDKKVRDGNLAYSGRTTKTKQE